MKAVHKILKNLIKAIYIEYEVEIPDTDIKGILVRHINEI